MGNIEFNLNANTYPEALEISELRAIEICEMMDGIYDVCAGNEGAYMAEVLSLAKTPAEVFLIGVYAGKASMIEIVGRENRSMASDKFPYVSVNGLTGHA